MTENRLHSHEADATFFFSGQPYGPTGGWRKAGELSGCCNGEIFFGKIVKIMVTILMLCCIIISCDTGLKLLQIFYQNINFVSIAQPDRAFAF